MSKARPIRRGHDDPAPPKDETPPTVDVRTALRRMDAAAHGRDPPVDRDELLRQCILSQQDARRLSRKCEQLIEFVEVMLEVDRPHGRECSYVMEGAPLEWERLPAWLAASTVEQVDRSWVAVVLDLNHRCGDPGAQVLSRVLVAVREKYRTRLGGRGKR